MRWEKIELQVYMTLLILLLAGVAILIDSKGVALMTVGFMVLFIMFLQIDKNNKMKTKKEKMEEVMYGLIMEKVWDAEGEVILDDEL